MLVHCVLLVRVTLRPDPLPPALPPSFVPSRIICLLVVYLLVSTCFLCSVRRNGLGSVWSRRAEGVGGLYRGIGAVLVGGVPGMCLYLTTYEATKGFLADRAASGGGAGAAVSGGGGILTHLTAGMLAEVVW